MMTQSNRKLTMRIHVKKSSSTSSSLSRIEQLFVVFLTTILVPFVAPFLVVAECTQRVPLSLFILPRTRTRSCEKGTNHWSSSTFITNRYYSNYKYYSQSVTLSPSSVKVRNYMTSTSTSSPTTNMNNNNDNDNKNNDPLSDNDAFAVFGNDDDDDNEKNSNDVSRPVRDPSNGMLMFHDGTEHALLLFVQNVLSQSTTGTQLQLNRVIDAIDQFCYERHWMMNIGPEKGLVLQEFLSESYQTYLSKSATTNDDNTFIIVELGTYCGYSLLRMAQTLLSIKNTSTKSFHIITVDVDKHTQQVAKSIIELAGLSNYVSFVLLKDDGTNEKELSDSVRVIVTNELQELPKKQIDFLFIDHEKPLYLRDLQQLEQSRLVQKGTSVAADNVYFHRINNYRQYIASLQKQNIVTTKFVPGFLEYVIPNELQQQTSNRFTANNVPVIQDDLLHDGIELTTYLEDPIVT